MVLRNEIVRLDSLTRIFQQIIPGGILRDDTYGGVSAEWCVRTHMDFNLAPTQERGEEMVRAFAEQMRARAIRELGLEPVLEGLRQEVRQFREANQQLQSAVDRRDLRIAKLQAALDTLEDSNATE